MSEPTIQSESGSTFGTGFRGNLGQTQRLLKLVYGLVPIIAGFDKFTNILTTWTDYLPAVFAGVIPLEPVTFMYLIGVIEIVAGIVVLTRYTEYGAYLVAAWLVGIAGTQILAGNYDIAVRDLVMAVGAVALAQLTVSQIDR